MLTLDLGVNYPFVLSLCNEGVDIRCIPEESIQQRIPFEKYVQHPSVCHRACPDVAGRAKMKGAVLSDSGGMVYLSAGGTLYTPLPVPIEQQVNQLLALRACKRLSLARPHIGRVRILLPCVLWVRLYI